MMKADTARGLLAALALCCSLQIAAQAASEKVLHSFRGNAALDGDTPQDGVIVVNGKLYGTTELGGRNSYNAGTVFVVDPQTDSEKVLHSFGAGTDGADPHVGLIDANGMLYGTTFYGGKGIEHQGTVFALNPNTGAERVIHSFVAIYDGANPESPLIDVNGTLYGTTIFGGSSADGALFSIDPSSGKETVVHSFGKVVGQGISPSGDLARSSGTLYGTTRSGGSGPLTGTAFSFSLTSGTVGAYSLCKQAGICPDGEYPQDGVILINGTLYGTTYQGGQFGNGTLFAIKLSTGMLTVLHAFGQGADGQKPESDLAYVNGTLYGTTLDGGSSGAGAVFAFDTRKGTESVIYSFGSIPDAQGPTGHLAYVKGTLYGTGQYGGSKNKGAVFAITLP